MRAPRAGLVALALLAGCARAVTTPTDEVSYHRLGELELSAMVERDLSDVLGAVDLMNTSRDTVRVEYAGSCDLAILVYDDRTGPEPSWDSAEWWAREGGCPTGMLRMDIPPVTLARIITPMVGTHHILGDSLPSGSYQAAIRLRIVQPRDTTLVLPAGRIELDQPASSPGFAGGHPLAGPVAAAHHSRPLHTPPPSDRHP